jgi:hypothetical protein
MIQVDIVSIEVSPDEEDNHQWVRITMNLRDGSVAFMDIGSFASPNLAKARVALLKQALHPALFEME